MGVMASQITNLTIVYSIVHSGADQRKHQSSASLAFVQGIHQWLVDSPHKWPVTRKMFSFDDIIMPNFICISSIRTSTNSQAGKMMPGGSGAESTDMADSRLCSSGSWAREYSRDIFWPLLCCIYCKKKPHKSIFVFSIISQTWYDADRWNPSLWKTRSYLSYWWVNARKT